MQVELSKKYCVKHRLVTFTERKQLKNTSTYHEICCEGNEQGLVLEDNRVQGGIRDQKEYIALQELGLVLWEWGNSHREQ